MSCQIMDGLKISLDIKKDIKQKVANFYKQTNVIPKLAIILGNHPASQIYVRNKISACNEVGILAQSIDATDDLKKIIRVLNKDDSVHGYILQLPLNNNEKPDSYFSLFDVNKDVDVFHPENLGLLMQGRPRFNSCTPYGIQMLLHRSGIKIAGQNIVIINRSLVVGRPLSAMLIQNCDDYANATVTVCHDQTPSKLLKELVLNADIVIVAVGKPGFITADMVRSEQVIVDVGINRIEKDGKSKVVGDVDFESVSKIVRAISPVPGGCGPLTVSSLLDNCLKAAKIQCGVQS